MHEIMQRLAKRKWEWNIYMFVPERLFPFITPASLEEQTTNRLLAVWETRRGALPSYIHTAMQSGGVARGCKELKSERNFHHKYGK
jgi:hypothetical protein